MFIGFHKKLRSPIKPSHCRSTAPPGWALPLGSLAATPAARQLEVDHGGLEPGVPKGLQPQQLWWIFNHGGFNAIYMRFICDLYGI